MAVEDAEEMDRLMVAKAGNPVTVQPLTALHELAMNPWNKSAQIEPFQLRF